MYLQSVAYEMGSKIVSNQDIIEKVREQSQDIHTGDLDKTLDQISYYLRMSGAKQRRWLAQGEKPIDMVCAATQRTLDQSSINKKDIDLILHVGLGRGFLEAGQAYFVAQALGMPNVHCFDIMDACNSWSRGMFVAYNFLKTGAYENILIVNTECNMMEGGIINPSNFRMKNFDNIEYSFAGLTLADACSATIISKDDSREWEFNFESRTDLTDLCAVPLENYQKFALSSDYLAKNGVHQFTSYAKQMNTLGADSNARCIMKSKFPLHTVDWIIPHGHSKYVYEASLKKYFGIDPKVMKWNTNENYGNFASACVPISIAMGMEAGEITRGQSLMTVMCSGGLSFSNIHFIL